MHGAARAAPTKNCSPTAIHVVETIVSRWRSMSRTGGSTIVAAGHGDSGSHGRGVLKTGSLK